MTSILQTLLDIDSPLFKAGLHDLEKSTGHSGVDTRLIADVLANGHKVMRSLGLDTKDTTGKEMYHALMLAVKNDDIGELLSDTDYTLMYIDGRVISLNLIDVIENSHHELKYDRQSFVHGRRALTGELIDRYVTHARTNLETSLEIFQSIGLLSSEDACYNITKYKHKQ